MERVEGIEPSWPAWKAGTLPLSYTRKLHKTYSLGCGSQTQKVDPNRFFSRGRAGFKKMGMTIAKISLPSFTLLELTGEIDLHSSVLLKRELSACAEEQAQVLLLDFRRVGYIDSSGLALLIEYLKMSSQFGGKLALFGLEKKVASLFALVRLDQLFIIAEDQDAALARLGVA